jgi:hypothetical protein
MSNLKSNGGMIMKMDYLKESYKDLLLSTGISSKKAEKASEAVTYDDLRIISEIWPDWGSIFVNQETGNALS